MTADPLEGDPRVEAHFGDAWPVLHEFADLLRRHGEERGLLGPREAERLWERHLLNSAAVVPWLAGAATVVDLGSGAGLPGIVVAALCPHAGVTLLEPMERRVAWLQEVVASLGLTNAVVRRGRAEEVRGRLRADAVVSRAVGSMDKLYRWGAPLVRPGGTLVALKGARAAAEVAAAQAVADGLGVCEVRVEAAPTLAGLAPTTVVVATVRRPGR